MGIPVRFVDRFIRFPGIRMASVKSLTALDLLIAEHSLISHKMRSQNLLNTIVDVLGVWIGLGPIRPLTVEARKMKRVFVVGSPPAVTWN